MIDHISLIVSDVGTSRAFYERALAPLGYRTVAEYGPVVGLGAPADEAGPVADLWLVPGEHPQPVHLALTAGSVEEVEAFHAAGLEAGGSDNGGPGERPQYHPGYYGAFILDPDGHNLEVVCHEGPVGQEQV